MKCQILERFVITKTNKRLEWAENIDEPQIKMVFGDAVIEGDILVLQPETYRKCSTLDNYKKWLEEIKILPAWKETKYYRAPERTPQGVYPVFNIKTNNRVRSKESKI